jgi:hypothetical protein
MHDVLVDEAEYHQHILNGVQQSMELKDILRNQLIEN